MPSALSGLDFRVPCTIYPSPSSWYQDERSIERIPREGTIETAVPSPDFELMMWQA